MCSCHLNLDSLLFLVHLSSLSSLLLTLLHLGQFQSLGLVRVELRPKPLLQLLRLLFNRPNLFLEYRRIQFLLLLYQLLRPLYPSLDLPSRLWFLCL